MQPYFIPYIGYFQLISAVDLFILYDNAKYTKKGWINRNRVLQNGRAVWLTLPLRGDSDYLDIAGRRLASEFSRDEMVARVAGMYRRAPYFSSTLQLFERIMGCADDNLFAFIEHSVRATCDHLGLKTPITRSSDLEVDQGLRGQERVIALCRTVRATTYLNPPGGRSLYSGVAFRENGIELRFLQPGPFTYAQFGDEFVPSLSIIDVLMFNSLADVQRAIHANFTISQ